MQSKKKGSGGFTPKELRSVIFIQASEAVPQKCANDIVRCFFNTRSVDYFFILSFFYASYYNGN